MDHFCSNATARQASAHASTTAWRSTRSPASASYRWTHRRTLLKGSNSQPSLPHAQPPPPETNHTQHRCSRRLAPITASQKTPVPVVTNVTTNLLESKRHRRGSGAQKSQQQVAATTVQAPSSIQQHGSNTSSKSSISRNRSSRSTPAAAATEAAPSPPTDLSSLLQPVLEQTKQHISDLLSAIAQLAPPRWQRMPPAIAAAAASTTSTTSSRPQPAAFTHALPRTKTTSSRTGSTVTTRTPASTSRVSRGPRTGTVLVRAKPSAIIAPPRQTSQQQHQQQAPLDPYHSPTLPSPAPPPPAAAEQQQQFFKLWALFVLAISYVHQSTTSASVPAMLPMIGPDLGLSDFQGAMLTTGYSYLYALALVPLGLLADKLDRPKLLAGGLALWSGLTVAAAHVGSFRDLMTARIGFAAAQAAQNPISFSLIPDLFPANKSTAMAVYNCAIYLGRALSFGAVIQARSMHAGEAASSTVAAAAGQAAEAAALAAGGIMVPLDKLDLSQVSILYVTGDSAVIAPVYSYSMELQMMKVAEAAAAAAGVVADNGAWRDVLTMLALPGFVISGLLLATVADPKQQQASSSTSSKALATNSSSRSASSSASGVVSLLTSSAFMTVTLAAALNDVGSYAFLAWQSTFYERVYHLEPSAYAPVLAAVLPLGGIVGGVGGGFLADALSKVGQRAWITVGASMLSAPLIADSVLAGTPEESFLALLLGFGLSEAWRAPSAVLIRSIAPQEMGSTASAVYLCVRNLVGGLGPLAVAKLADVVGLQQAMLLAPVCYAASGLLFLAAEVIVKQREGVVVQRG